MQNGVRREVPIIYGAPERWKSFQKDGYYRDKNGKYQKFDSEAPPMGVIHQKNKSIYKINKQVLNGNKFYVFTDGLSESLNAEGQEIGIEGSIEIIEDNYTKDSKKHLSDISKKIIDSSKSGKLSDDLTLISIG